MPVSCSVPSDVVFIGFSIFFSIRFSDVLIDVDALRPFLVVQSAALLDENGGQPDGGHHQHGDEPGEFPQDDGESDESHEGHAYGHRRQREETAPDAHELQRFLESFEHGEAVLTVLIFFHDLREEKRQSL